MNQWLLFSTIHTYFSQTHLIARLGGVPSRDWISQALMQQSTAARLVATSIDEVVQGGDTLQLATDEALMRLHQLSSSVQASSSLALDDEQGESAPG